MDSKVRLLYHEERPRPLACDQSGRQTLTRYLGKQRWQFWAGMLLLLLGTMKLGWVLGWYLGKAINSVAWLSTDVSGVKSGVAGWKWGEVRSMNSQFRHDFGG